MWNKSLLIVCLVSLAAAACAPGSRAGSIPSGPLAWIDAPLPGSSLPLQPYQVIAHAADPDGVTEFEFSVNGVVAAVYPAQASGQNGTLSTLSWDWPIPAPGTYLLQVRAAGRDGSFGPPAHARVTVEDTAPATPSAGGFSEPAFSEETLYHGRTRCGPDEVRVDISIGNPQEFGNPDGMSLLLFFRVARQGSDERTEWDSTAMDTADGLAFTGTLHLREIPGSDSFPEAWLQTQFILTDSQDNVLLRSPVYSSVSILGCGPAPRTPPTRSP